MNIAKQEPTEVQHTLTPWHLAKRCATMIIGSDQARIADTDQGSGIGMSNEENEANACFIVKAVNSYDKLVDMLRSTVLHLHALSGPESGEIGAALRAICDNICEILESEVDDHEPRL